jgi:hypothetical protein
MAEEAEFENLFVEPEEVPATPAASAAHQPSSAPSLEEVVGAVERALRRLDSVLAVHDVLCREEHDYMCLFSDGSLVCGHRSYTWEELSEVAGRVRKHAKLASLIYDLFRRGVLPSDVSVYTLRRGEPRIVANTVVLGPCVALVNTMWGQSDIYYVFELGAGGSTVVYLGFGTDWKLEATALYVGSVVARRIAEELLDIIQRACLLSAEPSALSQVHRLARKLSQL